MVRPARERFQLYPVDALKGAVVSSNALFADLYEFAMLRAYFELGMNAQATFSLFVRELPPQRNF